MVVVGSSLSMEKVGFCTVRLGEITLCEVGGDRRRLGEVESDPVANYMTTENNYTGSKCCSFQGLRKSCLI